MKIQSLKRVLGVVGAGLASQTSALATFSPGPSYSVGIPSSSTISQSSTGGIYFQLSAPTSYQWVGLGIGSQMAGATIFVMYADGQGNVTISARDGNQGHVEPVPDSSLQSGVTLLEGSGIVNGRMIANVYCTTCKLDSSKSSTSSPWICAWNQGSALNSQSTSATITQHALNNIRQFDFDLTSAVISSDSNPFVSSSSSATGSSPSGTAAGSSPSSSASSSGDSSSNSGSSGATVVGTSFKVITDYETAHGVIMGSVMVLLLPLGAIFMRLGGSVWAHGAWQVFSLCAMLCGFGLGIKLAQMRSLVSFPFAPGGGGGTFPFSGGNGPAPFGFPFSLVERRSEIGRLYSNTHTIFGTVIVGLFLLQPFFGLLHHLQYRKTQSRVPVSYLHIWYGRTLMVCGVVNGGLGLQLAANSHNGMVAYSVVAGVVGVLYIAIVVFRVGRRESSVVDGGRRSRRKGVREVDGSS